MWKKSLQSFVQLPLGVQERNKIRTQMLTDGETKVDRSNEGEVTVKKKRDVIKKMKIKGKWSKFKYTGCGRE